MTEGVSATSLFRLMPDIGGKRKTVQCSLWALCRFHPVHREMFRLMNEAADRFARIRFDVVKALQYVFICCYRRRFVFPVFGSGTSQPFLMHMTYVLSSTLGGGGTTPLEEAIPSAAARRFLAVYASRLRRASLTSGVQRPLISRRCLANAFEYEWTSYVAHAKTHVLRMFPVVCRRLFRLRLQQRLATFAAYTRAEMGCLLWQMYRVFVGFASPPDDWPTECHEVVFDAREALERSFALVGPVLRPPQGAPIVLEGDMDTTTDTLKAEGQLWQRYIPWLFAVLSSFDAVVPSPTVSEPRMFFPLPDVSWQAPFMTFDQRVMERLRARCATAPQWPRKMFRQKFGELQNRWRQWLCLPRRCFRNPHWVFRYITSDGYSASLVFERPGTKHSRARRRSSLCPFEVPPPSVTAPSASTSSAAPPRGIPADLTGWRVLAADPGIVRKLTVAERTPGAHGVQQFAVRWMSSKEFRHRAYARLRWKRVRMEKRTRVADVSPDFVALPQLHRAIGNLKRETPSGRTANEALFIRHVLHVSAWMDAVLTFEAQRRVKKLRFDRAGSRRRALDLVANRLIPPLPEEEAPKGTLFVVGRGKFSVEVRDHLRRVRRDAVFVSIDEFRSSMLCSRCHSVLKPMLARSTSTLLLHYEPVYSVRVCPNCSHRMWNRDVNAAINLLNIFEYAHSHGGVAPDAFRRGTNAGGTD